MVLDSDPGLADVAAALSRSQTLRADNAILSRVPVSFAGKKAFWYAVTKPNGYTVDQQGEIGRIASALAGGNALWIHYSDSTGREAFKLFRNGQLVSASDPSDTASFSKALRVAGEQTIREPEDFVDLLQSSSEPGDSVWIIRDGKALAQYQAYVPSNEHSVSAAVLDREFESLKPLRTVFRGIVWTFGGVVALLILWVVAWYLVEMLR